MAESKPIPVMLDTEKDLLDAKNDMLSREMSPHCSCQKVGKGELK